MKTAAAFCFAAAGIGCGLLFCGRLKRRVRILQQLCVLLREIENRTVYLHLPFGQTVQTLSQSEAFSTLSFLADCAERCRAGVPFPRAWNTAVSVFTRAQSLHGDGAQMLAQLGASLTCANDTQLERVFALYMRVLQSDLCDAKQRLQTSEKPVLCLCAAGGILLGIMVL